MNYDDLLELVQKRRSARRFKPAPVPDEYIDKIIEVARWAPSSLNQQPWEFVVVKDLELRRKILGYCEEYRRFSSPMNTTAEPGEAPRQAPVGGQDDLNMAPVLILLFGDTRGKQAEPRDLRYNPATLQDIFSDGLASALMYMHLAATTLGLGSKWNSVCRIPYPRCMIERLLGVPEKLELHDMMMLGYPAAEPRPKRMRNKERMVHYDYCEVDDFRTDEEVKDFI